MVGIAVFDFVYHLPIMDNRLNQSRWQHRKRSGKCAMPLTRRNQTLLV
jgi:hypothetical protein